MSDKVRLLRIIEYIGPREWVEEIVSKSIQGTKIIAKDKIITAVTLGTFPEILKKRKQQK